MPDRRSGGWVAWTAALAFVLHVGPTANVTAQSGFSTCTDTITPPSAGSDEIHAAIQ